MWEIIFGPAADDDRRAAQALERRVDALVRARASPAVVRVTLNAALSGASRQTLVEFILRVAERAQAAAHQAAKVAIADDQLRLLSCAGEDAVKRVCEAVAAVACASDEGRCLPAADVLTLRRHLESVNSGFAALLHTVPELSPASLRALGVLLSQQYVRAKNELWRMREYPPDRVLAPPGGAAAAEVAAVDDAADEMAADEYARRIAQHERAKRLASAAIARAKKERGV